MLKFLPSSMSSMVKQDLHMTMPCIISMWSLLSLQAYGSEGRLTVNYANAPAWG